MSRVLAQGLLLMAVYLLVMTSTEPADAVAGMLLGLTLAGLLRPRRQSRHSASSPATWLISVAKVLGRTVDEMVRGSWRTARFCLRGEGSPGFVEIPRAGRSRHSVALWGVLTGEAPDEVPVDVDEDRDVLIVHLVDASDPERVRERHRRAYEGSQGKVVA